MNPFDAMKMAEQEWETLDPFQKREVALLLSQEAGPGVHLPSKVASYAGQGLNPHFEEIMRHRMNFARDPELASDYARLGKVASIHPPDAVAEVLCLLDEKAGIINKYGSALPDPILPVFGGQTKVADCYSWIHGGDYVNQDQLEAFANNHASRGRLKDLFNEDVCDAFRKSPVETFKKMPIEQQILVARLAGQSSTRNSGGAWKVN